MTLENLWYLSLPQLSDQEEEGSNAGFISLEDKASQDMKIYQKAPGCENLRLSYIVTLVLSLSCEAAQRNGESLSL